MSACGKDAPGPVPRVRARQPPGKKTDAPPCGAGRGVGPDPGEPEDQRVMSTSLVSGMKVTPMATEAKAIRVGYQRP